MHTLNVDELNIFLAGMPLTKLNAQNKWEHICKGGDIKILDIRIDDAPYQMFVFLDGRSLVLKIITYSKARNFGTTCLNPPTKIQLMDLLDYFEVQLKQQIDYKKYMISRGGLDAK